MATVRGERRTRAIDYPTGDGKPMAETPLHMGEMVDTIQRLQEYYDDRLDVYIAGNMMLYYEEGNPRKHVSPDVFAAFGVPKDPMRDLYLVWKEGKAPDLVVEITSKSTRKVDEQKKFVLYRDVLKVTEYMMFDPRGEYLNPPLQGFRLINGEYVRIEPVNGRIPSEVLGLHLERDGQNLKLYDPATGTWLQTPREGREVARRIAREEARRAEEETRRAEEETRRAEEETRRAEEEHQRAEDAEAARLRVAEENERLLREIEALRRTLKPE